MFSSGQDSNHERKRTVTVNTADVRRGMRVQINITLHTSYKIYYI